MEILQTLITALVVASVGLILARIGSQRFDAIDAGLVRVEQRLDARIDALDAKIDALDRKFEAKFDGLDRKFDTKIDSLRTDLTGIALAVGVRQARGMG